MDWKKINQQCGIDWGNPPQHQIIAKVVGESDDSYKVQVTTVEGSEAIELVFWPCWASMGRSKVPDLRLELRDLRNLLEVLLYAHGYAECEASGRITYSCTACGPITHASYKRHCEPGFEHDDCTKYTLHIHVNGDA